MRFCVLICIEVTQSRLPLGDQQLPPTHAVKGNIFYTTVGIYILDELPVQHGREHNRRDVKCDITIHLHLDTKFKITLFSPSFIPFVGFWASM